MTPISIEQPPLDEQKAIAHFLDHKIKQIDDLIAKKEALIEKQGRKTHRPHQSRRHR
ncbi:hypothetical protein [Brasilonema bromeliae]|uniref:hypothetical protein n=1 Tax=Brasilonema bromeliae TaxID=383615 RepID=UPI001FE9817A|nr:hypothetical protein [Brasilonema bromeliae]